MSRDIYEFDGTPVNERCAQAGATEYVPTEQQRIEIAAFRDLIERTIKIPDGVSFKVASREHDFGVYLVLQLSFDDDNDKHWDFINAVDDIEDWDREALQKLQADGYLIALFIDEDRLYRACLLYTSDAADE